MSENHETARSQAPEKIDIYDLLDRYLKVLRRMWWVVLLLGLLGSAAGYFYAVSTYQPYYTAYTTFTISRRTEYGYTASYYNGSSTSASQMAKTFPYIISSSALEKLIADDLGMDSVPARISASAVEDTNLFTIRVEASDPQLAYDVLQSVITNYPQVAQYIIGETQLNYLEESGVPVWPQNSSGARRKLVMMGAAGTLAGLLIVLYFTMNRNTIGKEEDFSTRLNVRCLGSLPLVQFKKRHKKSGQTMNICSSRVPAAYRDAIRVVRTRVMRVLMEHNAKTFLVTSAVPREGKSTFSTNLAISLAQTGAKVILIDCDLRNPSVETTLGKKLGGKGLLHVLAKECTLEEALHHLDEEQIYVLTQGEGADRHRSSLREAEFAAVIREAESMAEYVVVDTPPVGVLADALVISGVVRQAIFVVKQDYARISDILEGVRSLKDSGVHLVGCVLNHMEGGITRHYGYGRYGYGRYGYGKEERLAK